MSPRGGTCPKCGSTTVSKERIMGADTIDLIWTACKYAGHPSEFRGDNSDDRDPPKVKDKK